MLGAHHFQLLFLDPREMSCNVSQPCFRVYSTTNIVVDVMQFCQFLRHLKRPTICVNIGWSQSMGWFPHLSWSWIDVCRWGSPIWCLSLWFSEGQWGEEARVVEITFSSDSQSKWLHSFSESACNDVGANFVCKLLEFRKFSIVIFWMKFLLTPLAWYYFHKQTTSPIAMPFK